MPSCPHIQAERQTVLTRVEDLSRRLLELSTPVFVEKASECLRSLDPVAEMTHQRLRELVEGLAGSIEVDGPTTLFHHDGVEMAMVVDTNADRMRIMAPIIELANTPPELPQILLEANYHSALDARYAVDDGIVWAAYIHPLSPLSAGEVESALEQVASLYQTFGTTFSSTDVVFGG